MFLNKAISDCFVNLSPIFTIFIIFSILVNNGKGHISHHFGCHENHFGMNLCFTIVPIYIIKWAGTVIIQGVHHGVGILTISIQIITVKCPEWSKYTWYCNSTYIIRMLKTNYLETWGVPHSHEMCGIVICCILT